MIIVGAGGVLPVAAQDVLFDFDNAPPMTSLPVTLSTGGITAHFMGTGGNFSIQAANTMGFTPAGFGGYCIYPNSVFQADLLVTFDQPLTDFSILYACQELGCDDAATMRVTAYMVGTYVGTATRTATFPGTWPSDTLHCTFPQGFDSLAVHYDSHPPTCQDYGVIFMADNMRVTALSTHLGGRPNAADGIRVFPNPTSGMVTIERSAWGTGASRHIEVFNAVGAFVHRATITGDQNVLDLSALPKGVYQLRITSHDHGVVTGPLIIE